MEDVRSYLFLGMRKRRSPLFLPNSRFHKSATQNFRRVSRQSSRSNDDDPTTWGDMGDDVGMQFDQ
eukprot:scaffold41656_cov52-Attheya_sp.AAC.3